MNTNISKQIRAYLNKHLCRDYHNAYGELIEDPHYFMYENEMGTLIELVVKECANIVNETRWMVPPTQEQIARNLLERCGLKE